MGMIKRLPHRAAQVEDLTICYCFEGGSVKRNLYMFPNVRNIGLWCRWNNPCDCSSDFSKPVEIAQTKSKVQYITDNALCEYASQMMTSNLCDQLLSLHLNFKNLRISWQTILPQMKNMPVLEKLNLVTPYLSVANMELLHKNIPSIQSLILNTLEIQDSETPPVIIPATQLRTIYFCIDRIDDLGIHMKWYRYAAQKYTSVKECDYHDDLFIDIEDSQYIYENGYLQFLSLVASTQSELALVNIPENINVFEALDDRNCQVKDFWVENSLGETLFQDFAQSNQCRYVEELGFSDTELGSFQHFQHFTVLSKLALHNTFVGSSVKVNLTDCLNSLPDTLKELELRCGDLKANAINCKMNSIEKLCISCDCITKNIVNTVISCSPKLVDLSLFGGLVRSVNVTLHSPSLKSFVFGTLPLPVFSYKSPANPVPVYYVITNQEKVCVRYEDVETKPILSVVSFTKRTLEFKPESVAFVQDD